MFIIFYHFKIIFREDIENLTRAKTDSENILQQLNEEHIIFLKNIQKILRGGMKIYIASRGDLNDVDGISQREYDFPGIGRFKSNGRSLEFVAISNEHDLCYGAHRGWFRSRRRATWSLFGGRNRHWNFDGGISC